MTLLRPFPGLVVDPDWADRVTTGPYDAYSPIQRAAIAAANIYSFLHVTRSQEDVAPELRDDVEGLLAGNCAAMQRLYDAGAYVAHDEPTLFLYRLTVDRPDGGDTGRHRQTGEMTIIECQSVFLRRENFPALRLQSKRGNFLQSCTCTPPRRELSTGNIPIKILRV